MIDAFLAKVFGTQNERDIKAMLPTVAAINARASSASVPMSLPAECLCLSISLVLLV